MPSLWLRAAGGGVEQCRWPGRAGCRRLRDNGLRCPSSRPSSKDRWPSFAPGTGAPHPIDLGAEANATMYEKVLGLLLACDEVDAVAVNFTPPLVNRRTDEVATAIVSAVDGPPAPCAPGAGAVARPLTWASPWWPASWALTTVASHPALRPLPGTEFHLPGDGGKSPGPRLSVRPGETAPQGRSPGPRRGRERSPPALPHGQSRRRRGLAPGWVTGAAAMDVLAAFGWAAHRGGFQRR